MSTKPKLLASLENITICYAIIIKYTLLFYMSH